MELLCKPYIFSIPAFAEILSFSASAGYSLNVLGLAILATFAEAELVNPILASLYSAKANKKRHIFIWR